jgi:hypothetical protein
LSTYFSLLPVVCWSGICGLGSIEIGSLGPINRLPFDHTSVCPESLLGLLPDFNKPPVTQTRESEKPQPLKLRSRALLTDDGAQVLFHRERFAQLRKTLA